MKKINILTTDTTPNSFAFNYPLKVNKRRLNNLGLNVELFYRIKSRIFDCDVLCINSGYYRSYWRDRKNRIFSDFEMFRERRIPIYWFDTTDSTFSTQAEVLPFVKCYCKNQLFKDRTCYKKKYYGGRIYTDYYHKLYGVKDDVNPFPSTPIEPEYYERLKVSWNSGLDNHGLGCHNRLRRIKHYFYDRMHIPYKYDTRFINDCDKSNDISCRLGTRYNRNTAAIHRKKIIEIVRKRGISTSKIKSAEYFCEIEKSKICVGPFGLGEITIRDYEIFIGGSLLLKPCVEHMETWPDLFVDNETYVSFRWDLSDFEEKIENLLKNQDIITMISMQGQEKYKYYFSEEGQEEFCEHFKNLIFLGASSNESK